MSSIYSFSKINTFKSCPQQYKIVYIDKIFNNSESIESFMGKRVHEVLEWLYSDKDLKNEFIVFDRLLEKYNELWNENFHEDIFISKFKYNKNTYNKNSLYKIGADCLKNYYKKFNINGYFSNNMIATELKFQIKIGKYDFRGFIDRIDENEDGSLEIIDYKTSRKSKSFKQARNDLQMAIYYMAAKELYKKSTKINLNLFYLRNDEIVHLKDDIEKNNELKKKIEKMVFDIENNDIYLAKESLLCEWCYYWKECEVKSSPNPSIRVF